MIYNTPHSYCNFGLARRDITPPVGIYHRMWGAAAHDRSEGVHRPLTATAMVFESVDVANREDSQGNRQIVVAVDHCLLFDREMQEMLEKVKNACSLNREDSDDTVDELLIAFSHTHAAGLMEQRRGSLPGGEMIAPYLEQLAGRIAETIQEALGQMQPAAIQYAKGRCSLAAHRDFWDERNQLYVCGFNPTQDADDTVLTAQVRGENGQLLANVVNYACHPTTLAWDNRLISPDYIGAMREVVEQATGAACVFLQGAAGELGPVDGFVGDFAVADRNGRQLGYAALSALESLPPLGTHMHYQGPVISGATIGAWRHEPLSHEIIHQKKHWRRRRQTVDLPYRASNPSRESIDQQMDHWSQTEAQARQTSDDAQTADARAMVERMSRWQTRLAGLPEGPSFPYPFTTWRIGDAIWAAVEGEPYSLLQRALRERFPKTPLMILELANGSRTSYVPPADVFGKEIYQAGLAVLEQGCLETLIEAMTQEIEELLE